MGIPFTVVNLESGAMTSIGFVTTIRIAFGEVFAISIHDPFMMLAFAWRRSLLDIPGFLARPAVITTTSEPVVSENLFVPFILDGEFQSGHASARSRAFPWGNPSTISKSATSAMPD